MNSGSNIEYRNPSYDNASGATNADRVYEAKPVIVLSNGSEIVKSNNRGVSSLFPDSWPESKIIEEVEYAIKNNKGKIPEKPNGNEFYGMSSDGKVEIHFYYDIDGSIRSYFPKKR